tara:strand:- start:2833 stop:3231 length:399 start_codon:yes stop_codon:yes gene_type:complete
MSQAEPKREKFPGLRGAADFYCLMIAIGIVAQGGSLITSTDRPLYLGTVLAITALAIFGLRRGIVRYNRPIVLIIAGLGSLIASREFDHGTVFAVVTGSGFALSAIGLGVVNIFPSTLPKVDRLRRAIKGNK